MSFKSKVVLITGAASGMGAEIALSFAKLNANLCITDINEKDLLKVKGECEEYKIKVREIVADISKDEDVKKIVASAVEEFGQIDVLVNCAGIFKQSLLEDSDVIEQFDRTMSVNLRAPFVMTKEAVPALIKSKGCVINISSVATDMMMFGTLAYNVSKAGVNNLTKASAYELGNHGVRVNCISPGTVKTNILINSGLTKEEYACVLDDISNKTPLKRIIQVNEIADLVVYLASDSAKSITGSNFVIDAGLVLGSLESTLKLSPNNGLEG